MNFYILQWLCITSIKECQNKQTFRKAYNNTSGYPTLIRIRNTRTKYHSFIYVLPINFLGPTNNVATEIRKQLEIYSSSL